MECHTAGFRFPRCQLAARRRLLGRAWATPGAEPQGSHHSQGSIPLSLMVVMGLQRQAEASPGNPPSITTHGPRRPARARKSSAKAAPVPPSHMPLMHTYKKETTPVSVSRELFVSVTKFNLIVCLCTKPTSRAYKGLVHIRYPLSELPPASSLEMTSSYPSSNHATHGLVNE